MKKIAIVFFTILIIGTSLVVGAHFCYQFFKENIEMVDNDQQIANKNFEKFLDALQSEDEKILLSLFSDKVAEESLHNKVDDLFSYYDGEILNYDDLGALGVSTDSDGEYVYQSMDSTYDVKTTIDEYRFAVRYISKDSKNPNNIGIESLYIIRLKDDINPDFAYWGDGKYTPGINIGIKA